MGSKWIAHVYKTWIWETETNVLYVLAAYILFTVLLSEDQISVRQWVVILYLVKYTQVQIALHPLQLVLNIAMLAVLQLSGGFFWYISDLKTYTEL